MHARLTVPYWQAATLGGGLAGTLTVLFALFGIVAVGGGR